MRVALLATCATVVAAERGAAADPVPPAPVYVEAYPHRVTERPLLLPTGILEGTVRFDYQHLGVPGQRFDVGHGVLGGRMSLGKLELEGTVSLFVFQTGELVGMATDPSRFTEAGLAARLAITPDKAVGIDVHYVNTGDGVIAPKFVAIEKLHVGPRAAIVLAGYVGGNTAGSDLGYSSLFVEGEARAQAQLTEHVMVEAGGTIGYFDVIGTSTPLNNFPDDHVGSTIGARMVVSITCALDVVAGVDLLETGAADLQLFSIGLAGRRFR